MTIELVRLADERGEPICFVGDGDDTLTLGGDEADAFEAFVANEACDVMGRAGPLADADLLAAATGMLRQLRKDAWVLESYAELLEGSAPGIAGELAVLAAGVRAAISEATGESAR